jgi:DNA-binding SARP family transcriptional activator/streptogramin lyase
MDFRILGPLEVLDNDRVLDVGGGKQRSVLALLLLHANEVVSSDRLIEELWPEEPPPSAPKIVQAHVSRLRKALNGAGEGILLTRGHGYELRVEPDQLDVRRFQRLLDEGRAAINAGEPASAGETLRHALNLWRGPPLADFAYDSFAQQEIARLEELQLAAIEERIEADLAVGRHDAVVQELEQLVARHPLRERLRGQLMLALYRSGRQTEALAVYRDARRTLADDLGLEPSPTLQQLERAILAHDQDVQSPARRSARDRTSRKAGMLIAVGAFIVLGAATTVALIELTGNGNAGLASLAPDSVGVIDPDTNRIVGQIPVGAPTRIAFGRSGVWVVSAQDETVTRIDPKTRTALRTLPVGGPPVDVVVGDSAVWLLVSSRAALGGGPVQVARIDPKLNAIVRPIPIGTSLGFGSGPVQSLAAGDGAVWVESPSQQVRISRIDRATDRVATFSVGGLNFGFNSGTAGGVPGASGIAFDVGAVWVGSDAGVIRINAESKVVSTTIGLGVVVPTALAVGEHAIWVAARPGFRCCPAETVGTGTLTRIDPVTNSVKRVIPIGGYPAAVAVGEGSVWVADPGTRSVVRIDPKNGAVKRIRVGARPWGIAVGGGFVWISLG